MKRILFIDLPGFTVARRFVEAAWQKGQVEVVAAALPDGWDAPTADYMCPPFLFHQVDLTRQDEALETLVAMHQRAPWDAAVTYSEAYVPLVARFCERVGLPGVPAEAATLTRNKWLLAERLAEHGVLVPQTRRAETVEQLPQLAREMEFPLVVKPVNGMGSAGVIKLESPSDLTRALPYLHMPPGERFEPQGYLLQQYVAGPEVSVEGVAQGGTAHVLAVTDKRLGQLPFFVEVGHTVPSVLEDTTQAAIVDTVCRTVVALGMNNCGFHAELKVTPRGPVLLEIAARLAGGFIPDLAYLATGVNLYQQVLQASLGRPVDMTIRRRRAAAVQFLMPDGPGVVSGVEGAEEASRSTGVLLLEVDAHIGQVVSDSASNFTARAGAVLATAAESRDATARALEAASLVRIRTEPVRVATGD